VDVAGPFFDLEIFGGDDEVAHRGGGDVKFEVRANRAADAVLLGVEHDLA
jgi:hypothetical protein